jgi:hypothetical protein
MNKKQNAEENYITTPISVLSYITELERQLAEAREIVKAVAHVGIDWGYGVFELNQDHINKARDLYEQLKEQGEDETRPRN